MLLFHDSEFVLVARVYEIGRAKSNVWVSPLSGTFALFDLSGHCREKSRGLRVFVYCDEAVGIVQSVRVIGATRRIKKLRQIGIAGHCRVGRGRSILADPSI